ncbi:MAG TPA: hypothetical protein VIM73_07030 [Polyangiaceae bacterium]
MAKAVVLGCRGSKAWAGLAWVSAVTLAVLGCSKTETPPANPEVAPIDFSPVTCPEDQVREFYCDGLLPMSTALGAPEPYGNCPAGIESPPGVHRSRQRVARFDAAYTEWARQRAKPGHACCYSWCADVEVRAVSDVPENAGCDQPGAVRESYCMPELEGGSSIPADSPWERCPLAIRPPEAIHFSVPKAAPLDFSMTGDRRGRGLTECCYGWCSRMPAGVLPEKKSSR